MQVLFDIPNFSCIMQLRAENQNLVSALSNYQQILYQFFEFTQNLKRSHIRCYYPRIPFRLLSRFLVNGTCCNLEVVPGCCKTFPSLAFPKSKMVPAKRTAPKRKLISRRQYSRCCCPFCKGMRL